MEWKRENRLSVLGAKESTSNESDRCACCGKIGFTVFMCCSLTVRDKAGQTRVVAMLKRSGILIESKVHDTGHVQLQAMKGVVTRLLSATDKKKLKPGKSTQKRKGLEGRCQ